MGIRDLEERVGPEPDAPVRASLPGSPAAAILALQRTAGNRAVGRRLARKQTVAEQVQALADKQAWKRASALLGAQPMAALLDTLATLETNGRLTWIEINLDSSLPRARRERILAAATAVQHAAAEEQMAHRLALNAADEKALDAWTTAHPDPLPEPDATPDPIKRKDGTVFEPPASATSDRDWARALLRFYHLLPAPQPGAAADACVLDGNDTTAGEVALLVAEAGLFGGGHLIDGDDARKIVDEMLNEGRGARATATQVESLQQQRDWAAILELLKPIATTRLLAVLDVVRADGKLEQLIDKLVAVPPNPRITAALLAAGGHLGLRFDAAAKDLLEVELTPLRDYLFQQVVYNDLPQHAPLLKAETGDPNCGKPFQRPAGAPVSWASTADDDTWIDAFLRYFHILQVQYDDDHLWFNESMRTLDEIVDITVEQGLLAGRMLTADSVKKVIAVGRPSYHARAADEPSQLVLQYTFVPVTHHKDLKTGDKTKDKPAQQLAAQYTIKFKNVGFATSEIDISALVQATFFADPSTENPKLDPSSLKLQSLVGGVQAAWAVNLFTKKIQLQAVLQAAAGAARDYEANGDGTLTIKPVFKGGPFTAQAAGQVQIVVTPIDGLPLQFFIGTQGSITKIGPTTTLDGTPVMIGIQGTFDLF